MKTHFVGVEYKSGIEHSLENQEIGCGILSLSAARSMKINNEI
jgi:hypothetical protein